jgi:hypothetical protein
VTSWDKEKNMPEKTTGQGNTAKPLATTKLAALFRRPFRKLQERLYQDSRRELLFVHIGKCGGAALWDALLHGALLGRQFLIIKRIHARPPPIRRRTRYIFVLRNPIARAAAAFDWRYKLVVEDRQQQERFAGERDVLLFYRTFGNLAESLYKDGVLSNETAEHYNTIHQLKDGMSFYLDDLLKHISSEQVHAVLCKETLDADMGKLFNRAAVAGLSGPAPSAQLEHLGLSDVAMNNLRLFLANDFRLVAELCDLAGVASAKRALLLA